MQAQYFSCVQENNLILFRIPYGNMSWQRGTAIENCLNLFETSVGPSSSPVISRQDFTADDDAVLTAL